MNFDPTDEQRMLTEAARRYVRERCTLDIHRETLARHDGLSSSRWSELADMGWLALLLDEAQGGLGGGPVELALLMEQVGRGLLSEPLVDTGVIAMTLLRHPGASAAGLALRQAIAAGEAIAVLAHLEAGDRSEHEARPACRATPRDEGGGWRLDGVKHLVRHGARATHLLVSACEAGRTTPSLFLVPSGIDGLSLRAHELVDGARAADLQLDGVQLGAEARLLDAQAWPDALAAALDAGVLALCAAAVGTMETAMAMTAEHLKTRVQYGQPLARFQALQHRMAEMFVETDQSRALLWRAVAAAGRDDPIERARAVSSAKWLISRAALTVTGQAIQLHGGIGTTDECAIGHHYKSMVAFSLRLGDADLHLLRSGAGRG